MPAPSSEGAFTFCDLIQLDDNARGVKLIPIAKPMLGLEEITAVTAVLKSGLITQGAKVQELEAGFMKLCASTQAVAVNSGTAALHTALHAAGVAEGDEVIVPAFSFIASANAVLMQKAKPVFVDISEADFNIDPSKIEAAISPRTKAIVVVDLFGQPYDYTAVADIAKRHDLLVIEDACQAVGAMHGNLPAGSLGDFGCFSLYATKNITSAEGGIMLTNNVAGAQKARAFRQHGMTKSYDYDGLGYNYRLTDLAAAIGLEQLNKLEGFLTIRRRNTDRLNEGLAGIDGLVLPHTVSGRTHSYHQYTVRVTKEFGMSRDALSKKLVSAGVGSGIYYPKPLPAYAHLSANYRLGDFPEAERAATEVLSLPVHPGLSESNLDTIIQAVREARL
jgi:perosamine synthetase